jgi:AcrR family transcriptional regulator
MPTQTFWNLPADKRDALIAIAVDEFANNDYDAASISRIVARAGIAKGSIYQYFADKQDLFLHLLNLSNQTRLAYVQREAPPAAEIGFWALLRWQIGASTRAALAYPQLTRLFYRAIQGNLPFHNAMVHEMRAMALAYWTQFVEQGVTLGAIQPGVDAELAAVLLNAVFSDIGSYLMQRLDLDAQPLHELDSARFQTPEVERIFDQVVLMLERGLGALPRSSQEDRR